MSENMLSDSEVEILTNIYSEYIESYKFLTYNNATVNSNKNHNTYVKVSPIIKMLYILNNLINIFGSLGETLDAFNNKSVDINLNFRKIRFANIIELFIQEKSNLIEHIESSLNELPKQNNPELKEYIGIREGQILALKEEVRVLIKLKHISIIYAEIPFNKISAYAKIHKVSIENAANILTSLSYYDNI